jgi:hypothetical protein
MKKLLIYGSLLLFVGGSACSKRIVDQSRIKTDIMGVSKKETLFIDTSKITTYERYILLGDTSKLSPRFSSGTGNLIPEFSHDVSTWPPEAIVNYIKILPDNVKLQYLPVYYEKYTSGETGVSKQEKSETKTEVKKVEKEKKSETRSDIPWVVGIAFIILGIFLIIWVVPRKPKTL